MTNKYNIESLVGKGIEARVTNKGKLYGNYTRFAIAAGYPDAVLHDSIYGDKKIDSLDIDDNFDVLAQGMHGNYNDTLYVIESKSTGEQFLFSEEGLLIKRPPTIKDATFDELVAEIKSRYNGQVARNALDSFTVTTTLEERLWKPELNRDEIVKKAKEDVGYLTETMDGEYAPTEGNYTYYYHITKPQFFVNKEKRTIVALVWDLVDDEILERGFAKCAPDDCFNVHIGKAIALRRALGLTVPDEYLNAPQPTEVRVGDVVEYAGELSKVVEDGLKLRDEDIPDYCWRTSAFAEQGNIIDDSREEVSE